MGSRDLVARGRDRPAADLTAPHKLRGPMHYTTPQHIRDERDAWIAARIGEGYRCNAIAAALGVTTSTASYRARLLGLRPCDLVDKRDGNVTVWRGQKFRSQIALARHIGVSANIVGRHMARYGTADHLPEDRRRGAAYEWKGRIYYGQDAVARAAGTTRKSVEYHLRMHGHLDRLGLRADTLGNRKK